MVTPLVDADLLILLSNVEGVLDAAGQRISIVCGSGAVFEHRAAEGAQGRGGILSKVEAARNACRSGARAVVAQAHAAARLAADRGRAKTSARCSSRAATRSRRASTGSRSRLRPRGAIVVDRARCWRCRPARRACSPIGVLGVRGHFDPGDAVRRARPRAEKTSRAASRGSARSKWRASPVHCATPRSRWTRASARRGRAQRRPASCSTDDERSRVPTPRAAASRYTPSVVQQLPSMDCRRVAPAALSASWNG